MLFYVLDDIEKLVALDDREYIYVGHENILMQSLPESPHGDNQLAAPRTIQEIMNVLNDLNTSDLLVLIANDQSEFEFYPLTIQYYQDINTGTLVPYEAQDRLDLRNKLTTLLSSYHFRYGEI